MKITIDLQKKTFLIKKINLFSKNSFDIISNFWKLLGWKLNIHMHLRGLVVNNSTPEDLIRVQELILRLSLIKLSRRV